MIDSKGKIPLTILTGFLGSGKTTLLNQLLSSSELADTAVLINEFGEIGLDHLLVKAVDEEIILLESGCVCCSVRDDFSASLLMLYDKREKQLIPPFQRIVLETTGIADPIAIHELILADRNITQLYRCTDIITVVDAVYGEKNLDRHIEAVKQVSVADQIVISKTDLADQSQTENLSDRLKKLNPMATLLHCGATPINPSDLLTQRSETTIKPNRDFNEEHHQINTNHISHDQRFTTFHLSWKEAIDWDDFVAWLEALLIARGDSIHRLKGLLKVTGEEQPTVIQGVQHTFYPPTKMDKWPHDEARTELIFITIDFSKEAAIKSLAGIANVSVE